MQDEAKTKGQLIIELAELRRRVGELEASGIEPNRSDETNGRFVRKQAMIADLSSQSLRGWYIKSILDAAVRLTAETLEVDLCSIFKLDKSSEMLRLVAGVGWKDDLVGSATVGTGLESQLGYTAKTGAPVIVDELRSEERFVSSPLLVDHGVVSGMNVPMVAGDFVFGVMGVHTTQCREFSDHDVHFLESVANILTVAALRRQAVVALRQSNKGLVETKHLLTSLIDTSSDAIISTSAEGYVSICNKGAEDLLGYMREEVIGKRATMLYENEEGAEEVMQLMREGSGTLDRFETTMRAKDGSLIHVLLSASIMHDEIGQEMGSVRFHRDLRDRKRWEEEMEQVSEEIEKTQNALEQAQAEADAAGELREANEELNRHIEYIKQAQEQLIGAEKVASVGRLAAGVYHEVMNPLNIITMRLQLMISDPDTPPEISRHLGTLEDHANRIVKITQGLLDISRRREPEQRKVDLNELVRETLNLLEYELVSRNIGLVLGLPEGLPFIWADHDQVQQVILNLITNARDVMSDGGRLTLRTDVHQENGRNYLELRVEDTGEGIDPEHIDKIFDPFFTTKDEGKGTGLGLSICQNIIEAHGGSLMAENLPGGGAAFVARLPSRIRDDAEENSDS